MKVTVDEVINALRSPDVRVCLDMAKRIEANGIERLRKPYVPMTDDEWCEVSNAFEYDGNPLSEENEWKRERHIEQAVIKRTGLGVDSE
jgi:hypothetical protein